MRLADPPPAYCSGCFQAKPALRHVDFEVAWDGPTIADGITGEDGETLHTLNVSIDDLVLCEECACAAAALFGWVAPDEQTAQIEQLTEANRVLVEKLRGLEDYATRMEAAVSAKPKPAARPRQKVS